MSDIETMLVNRGGEKVLINSADFNPKLEKKAATPKAPAQAKK
jgi:hypothetical protein